MKSAAAQYLEESPLKEYLKPEVSELSFNGQQLFLNYVQHSRIKVDLEFNNEQAYELVRHIADLTGKNFNNSNPILDVSFDNYRMNAVHGSVASRANEPAVTFIIRLIYPALRIQPNDPGLCGLEVHRLLQHIVGANQSIMISGVTGSGKSELQKYLISLIPVNRRIVMIEDTYETHIKELLPQLDINIWIAKSQGGVYRENLQHLIKAGLRNNPDWLMISEVRGSEMMDLLQTVTSGLSIITTIHAQSALDTPNRMLQLMSEGHILNLEQLRTEIFSHIHFFLHMKKTYLEDGSIKRYLSEIVVATYVNQNATLTCLYEQDQNGVVQHTPLTLAMATLLKMPVNWFEGGDGVEEN